MKEENKTIMLADDEALHIIEKKTDSWRKRE